MSAVGKPKIVLLGQKDPTKEVELTVDEGPFESWLAVAQDMWGYGNLTPFDNIFASRAIGTIVPTQGGNFGALCYHLGDRLFTFSREGGIWIDAFEGQPAVSQLEKRPKKDKIKLAQWTPGKNMLGSNRLTHLAVLSPSRLAGTMEHTIREAAQAMKKGGQLFLADIMFGPAGKPGPGKLPLHRPAEYKAWLDGSGLKYYSEIDLTSDIQIALLRGLQNSLNMVANIRKLREPWKAQRFKAFDKELEDVVMLHLAMQHKEVVAMGYYYTKP